MTCTNSICWLGSFWRTMREKPLCSTTMPVSNPALSGKMPLSQNLA